MADTFENIIVETHGRVGLIRLNRPNVLNALCDALMTELGKRTSDLGVPLVYHHHMNSTGEKPEEIAAVLDAADPKHVRLLFDVAHYQQGGGDPKNDRKGTHGHDPFIVGSRLVLGMYSASPHSN